MTKRLFLSSIIILSLCATGFAQNPILDWAVGMGSTGIDEGTAIAIGASGNVYTTGHFGDKVDFDPGADSLFFISAGSDDIFLQKLDSDGKLIWVKQIGGAGYEYGASLAMDNNENVYLTGAFSGTVDFDPNVGVTTLTSAGNIDIFIQKFDSSGNLLWVKQFGAEKDDGAMAVDVDLVGNVYATGRFQRTVDFDPGPDSLFLSAHGFSDPADVFILKLNTDGDLIWAKSLGGANHDVGYNIIVDNMQNVYTTGVFIDVVDMNPNAGVNIFTEKGFGDIFILKLNSTGHFEWAKRIGDTGIDLVYGIALDSKGNVVICGTFSGSVDFNDGGIGLILSTVGKNDVFVQKLDTSGDLMWVKTVGGINSNSVGRSVVLDNQDNVYACGFFNETVNFNTGSGIDTLTSAPGLYSNLDIFILKLDNIGNYKWAVDIGDTLSDIGKALITDQSGSVYCTGHFSGTADFDPQSGMSVLSTSRYGAIFVLKFDQCLIDKIFSNSDTTLCRDEYLLLQSAVPNATYLWQDSSTSSSYLATYAGIYWLQITTDHCSKRDTVFVFESECKIVLELPNIITPNRDGLNEELIPIRSEGVVSLTTRIFNRWGIELFRTSDPMIHWNATDVPNGIYFWIVQYSAIDGKVYNDKGQVIVMR